MTATEIILVFVRLPEPGKVKTRLARTMGPEAAAALYAAFVGDVLETVGRARFANRVMYCPAEAAEALSGWLGPCDIAPQAGGDLGHRMACALAGAFEEGRERAVLIGSDSPDLPASVFEEAFEALKTHDAVIGPATDGGYYLIGFSKKGFTPDIFSGPEWGTGTVLKTTMELLDKAGKSVHCLFPHRDVDTQEDLAALAKRADGTAFMESRTMKLLTEKAK